MKRKLANQTKNKTQLTLNIDNIVVEIFPADKKNNISSANKLRKYLYKKLEEDKLIKFDGGILTTITKKRF